MKVVTLRRRISVCKINKPPIIGLMKTQTLMMVKYDLQPTKMSVEVVSWILQQHLSLFWFWFWLLSPSGASTLLARLQCTGLHHHQGHFVLRHIFLFFLCVYLSVLYWLLILCFCVDEKYTNKQTFYLHFKKVFI